MTKNNYLKKITFLIKEVGMIALYVFLMLFSPILIGFMYLLYVTALGGSLLPQNTPQTSYIYDRTGTHILYELYGEENRKIVTHSQIPDNIRRVTIAAEDASFYSHIGIDPLATLRALKNDIQLGYAAQGGSTITQQLARNTYLDREKTLDRKIMEAVYALKLERKYTKDEILDAYLNEVPYGSNTYGIESAAENFFGHPAISLTLDEAALLAALPKAPTYYSPYSEQKEILVARQKNILRKMAELKLASPEEISAALNTDTLKKIVPFSQPIYAPHFVFYVQDLLEKKYGQNFLQTGGLKIYTTLDYDKQQLAENIISNSNYFLRGYGAENAALVAIDPKTGQILSMVGSKNYFDPTIDGQVNVTTSPRQPGSSFKPIVYAEAFEKGFQPESLVLDASTNFGPDGSGRDYIPSNYDGKSHGVLSMRQALAMSLNIPAIKTLRAVGLPDAISMAHRLGITTLNDPKRYGLSLVIGGGEVTLLDETSAFSVFANDGKRNPVDPILKIVDNQEKVIYQNQFKNLPVLDSQIARKINSILSDNQARSATFGTHSALVIPNRNVAVKTGTTQEFHDAWTVGYTPDIAVGVWAGNNDNSPMHAGADGSFVAGPIWNSFISKVLTAYPNENFLAYEKSVATPQQSSSSEATFFTQKVTYYKLSNGKKISEKKALELGKDKVRREVSSIYKDSNGQLTSSNQGQPVL